MTAYHRNISSAAIIALAFIAALVCSIVYLVDAADDADRSTADIATTRVLVSHINAKRPVNLRIDSGDLGSQIPRLMDAAMKTAEIDPENLDRISPQPARPSGQSEMTEIPLELNFRQISLRQLLTFVTSLTDENGWLSVHDLHLAHSSAASSAGPSAVWDSEVTISYLTKSSGSGTASAN